MWAPNKYTVLCKVTPIYVGSRTVPTRYEVYGEGRRGSSRP